MSNLLGWASLGLGALGTYAGYKSSESQAESMGQAANISKEQLDFSKQQYQHFLDVYGPIEENLSTYYKSLTPEKYTAMGLDAYDKQFQAAEQSWQSQMAQRGLAGSGLEAEGLQGMQLQGAQQRAEIQQQAPQQWAQDQMGWLGLGTGQGNIAQQNIASGAANLANIYSSQAQTYGAQASAAGQGVGNLLGSVMQANAYQPGTISLGNPFSSASIPMASSWQTNNPSVASGAIAY